MRIFFLCYFLFSIGGLSAQSSSVIVDTHNDFLYKSLDSGYAFDKDLRGITHTDLDRLRAGGVKLQFFSVFCDGEKVSPYRYAMTAMDTLEAVIKRNPGKMVLIKNSRELKNAIRQGKLAAVYGVEGGHMMENDLSKLQTMYDRGTRYMTLTWNNSTDWASSAFDERFKKDIAHKGLTDFGKQVVRKMNELGMMVDVSHLGETSFWDVIATTVKPVIASHSSVYAFSPHQRNLKDEQILAIARNGGVIQVNFYSGFLDSSYERKKSAFFSDHKKEVDSLTSARVPDYLVEAFLFLKYPEEVSQMRPPLSLLIDHIDYIKNLAGIDHVGLGSDFDGIESAPLGLNDVTSYPLIAAALKERGYSRKELAKVLGGNLLRVWRENEKR